MKPPPPAPFRRRTSTYPRKEQWACSLSIYGNPPPPSLQSRSRQDAPTAGRRWPPPHTICIHTTHVTCFEAVSRLHPQNGTQRGSLCGVQVIWVARLPPSETLFSVGGNISLLCKKTKKENNTATEKLSSQIFFHLIRSKVCHFRMNLSGSSRPWVGAGMTNLPPLCRSTNRHAHSAFMAQPPPRPPP